MLQESPTAGKPLSTSRSQLSSIPLQLSGELGDTAALLSSQSAKVQPGPAPARSLSRSMQRSPSTQTRCASVPGKTTQSSPPAQSFAVVQGVTQTPLPCVSNDRQIDEAQSVFSKQGVPAAPPFRAASASVSTEVSSEPASPASAATAASDSSPPLPALHCWQESRSHRLRREEIAERDSGASASTPVQTGVKPPEAGETSSHSRNSGGSVGLCGLGLRPGPSSSPC